MYVSDDLFGCCCKLLGWEWQVASGMLCLEFDGTLGVLLDLEGDGGRLGLGSLDAGLD